MGQFAFFDCGLPRIIFHLLAAKGVDMCARMTLLLLAVSCFSLVGCGPKSDQDIVQIGSTKAAFLGPPSEFRALAPRLESALNKPVYFRAQPDGDALGAQLTLGEIDFAILSAKEFCEIDDASQLDLIATGVNATDRSARRAFIVVKNDSSISKVSDLKGKRFAYGTHNDLLTDYAVRATLRNEGLPPNELVTELLPPPIAYDGRLYAGSEAPAKVALPILRGDVIPISAAVIDEVAWMKLPDTGGNVITGPAKDDLKIIAKTMTVPELVVVAGPESDPSEVSRVRQYFLKEASKDPNVCEQLGVKGFTEPDLEQYSLARLLLN